MSFVLQAMRRNALQAQVKSQELLEVLFPGPLQVRASAKPCAAAPGSMFRDTPAIELICQVMQRASADKRSFVQSIGAKLGRG